MFVGFVVLQIFLGVGRGRVGREIRLGWCMLLLFSPQNKKFEISNSFPFTLKPLCAHVHACFMTGCSLIHTLR